MRDLHPEDLIKGLVAGVIAGLAGACAMNRFQELLGTVSETGQGAKDASGGNKHVMQRTERRERNEEPATLKTAEAISTRIFHHRLTKREKRVAEPLVHYAFGASV